MAERDRARQRHGVARSLLPYGVAMGTTALALGLTLLCQPALAATPSVGVIFILTTGSGRKSDGLAQGAQRERHRCLPPITESKRTQIEQVLPGLLFPACPWTFHA